MDRMPLYEEDVYAWSQDQARTLRNLARSGLSLPNDLDLEHVAEEIEEVGNEQRFAVESNLLRAMIHLIKMVALPDDQAVRGWTKEVNAFLDMASSRYRPSMRQALDFPRIWARACRRAAQDLEVDGHASPVLPEHPAFSLEDLVGGEADARRLAAALAAVTDAPRDGRLR